MRYFTLVQTIAPTSNLGYEEVLIVEWADEDLTLPRPRHFFMWSTRGQGCQCDAEAWDRPNKQHRCVHSALYMTWRRQGRLADQYMSLSRIYRIDDEGRISYRRGREIVELSTVSQVNRTA
jgi:hypothetical protein